MLWLMLFEAPESTLLATFEPLKEGGAKKPRFRVLRANRCVWVVSGFVQGVPQRGFLHVRGTPIMKVRAFPL